MFAQPWLAAAAVCCLIATGLWARAAQRLRRAVRRIEHDEKSSPGGGMEGSALARAAYDKD
ncbi:MAG: hypothetical protein J2O47_08675, partial [Acidimicrobiaceae bacterium]|nr:hypothetical protein [Acidimicrobiaceae bacterium]